MESKKNKPLIVALDFSSLDECLIFLDKVNPNQCRVKIGKQLFVNEGPAAVKKVCGLGFEVFLDLKFHDIPNTVRAACLAAADLGCWMVNVHASGGRAMLESASSAYANLRTPPLLVGVTILTSFSEAQLAEVGYSGTLSGRVEQLAILSQSSGLDGVVCSPIELALLTSITPDEFLLVTPGVRFLGDNSDDQTRISTPEDALENGADYLVMGRSIVSSNNPAERISLINDLSANI